MYASVADLRAEGVTVAASSDARLVSLLEEATRRIDRATGWFFEPRVATFRLDGRGTPSVEPPVPPIRVDRLSLGASELSLAVDDLVVVGAPVRPGFDAPRLTLRHGRVFPRGESNVVVDGLWGFTEDEGTREGRTPFAIRRACMMLALRSVPLMAHEGASDAASGWRLLEERVRDQSIRFAPDTRPHGMTGDPSIDSLLAPYVRPRAFGAA